MVDQLFDSNHMHLTRDHKHADWQYEVIRKQITEFEKTLDDDHEVGVYLSSFGQSVILHITDLGYQNPSLVYFYGSVNGIDSQIIQHVSQINILLTSVKKEAVTARRIGFASSHSE